MSLTQETLFELMALADDELEGEARARVEALVARSDEARRVVAALRHPAVGAFLRGEVEDHGPGADGIADLVVATLEGERAAAASSGPPAVAPLASLRRSTRAPRRSGATRVQLVALAATGALALAAGVTLYVGSGQAPATQGPVASTTCFARTFHNRCAGACDAGCGTRSVIANALWSK